MPGQKPLRFTPEHASSGSTDHLLRAGLCVAISSVRTDKQSQPGREAPRGQTVGRLRWAWPRSGSCWSWRDLCLA